jgi:hypothetical protein
MKAGLEGGPLDEVTSLECTLDRATESYALAMREQLVSGRTGTGDVGAFDRTTALALVRTPTFVVGQLRWKGVEVSDEFLRYAARVAKGEQLSPYRGEVLARPNVDFPWSTALSVPLGGATEPTLARARRRRRSKWLLGWVRGAGALILCVLLVGFGAAAMAGGHADPRASLEYSSSKPKAVAEPAASSAAASALPANNATPSAALARDAAPERTSLTKARAPLVRRRTSAVASRQATAPAPLPAPVAVDLVVTQKPIEPLPALSAPVRTIVGSTTLPARDERPAAESALLLETPPF